MTRKIGFIGSGKMAEAIIGGMVNSGYAQPEDVYASNRTMTKLLDLKVTYGIQVVESNTTIAEHCDFVFLSVKPDMYPEVIEEIKSSINEYTVIILIAGGQSISTNEDRFGTQVKMVKAMPNTPVLVEEGLTSISFNEHVSLEEREEIEVLFASFGKAEVIDESLMDIASAVGGSSPAFIYMYIEALADAAVLYGMPREQAYKVAAQSTLGAAKMVLETGEHPGKLKDDVCSPGGTTIQSVASLEDNGFRSAVVQAVRANIQKLEEN